MRLILVALVLLACGGCSDPKCDDGSAHSWSKWKPDGRKNMDGQDCLIRECEKCGWRQFGFESSR